jgi:hypothetical protein
VTTLATHPEAKFIIGCHKFALAEAQLANLQAAIDVFANDSDYIVVGKWLLL